MTLHRMAVLGAARFQGHGRTRLSMVTRFMSTARRLEVGKVKAPYMARPARFERLRQRVAEHAFPAAAPPRKDALDFDIGQHLHPIALPQARDRHALTRLPSDAVSTPLGPLRPLRQVHLVDDVDGGSARVDRTL